jgi:hypothetical protein
MSCRTPPVVSIGHRPGLEAFHTRELVLEPGDEGAQLRARPGQRGLRDIYRRMSAASRAEGSGPRLLAGLPQDVHRPLRKAGQRIAPGNVRMGTTGQKGDSHGFVDAYVDLDRADGQHSLC